MSKKQTRILTALLIILFLLLTAGMAIFAMLYLQETGGTGELGEEKAALQAQVEDLTAQNEALQKQIDEKDAEIQSKTEEMEQLNQLLFDTQEALDTAKAELEAIPEFTLDVGELDSGTTVSAEEIDWDNLEQYFQAYEIEVGDEVYNRIYGRSYVDNPNIGLDDLRYFKVLHYNFDHEIQVGELIANVALVQDYQEIFQELFENEYEIQSMHLIDNYWTGDGGSSDTASIDVNNTSAFCYRVVTGGGSLSNHAYGRAIDINPQQNPYVTYSGGYAHWYHSNANDYIDRTTGYEHMITHDDLCYKLFIEHGFTWGGDWNSPKDYQHFEKKN